jgi:hypothetical protein
MVNFQTKNTNLGKFWRALEWKRLVYIMAIWNILWAFGMYIKWTLVNSRQFWYISPHFGKLCQEKSGNPVVHRPEVQCQIFPTLHISS